MKDYTNIEKALPGKFYQYVGWDKAGNRFIIGKRERRWRATQVVVADYTIPYFYADTLRDVSRTLSILD
jgi:hypothetical protein